MNKHAPDCAMVIFGANGDLTKRLVVPALYNLSRAGLLPKKFALIGCDHNDKSVKDWCKALHDFLQQTLKDGTKVDETAWKRLVKNASYVTGDFTKSQTFEKLSKHLKDRDKAIGLSGNVLFYLATADRFFGPIVEALGKAKLTGQDGHWRRVVIEKPFGHDLSSARALNKQICAILKEDQVYRIDHFLGKETVQNIMALRFANGLFEPIWNCDRIDHVQITVAEQIGVGTRGSFYEHTGALRDMVPNHLFQLLAMTAMEPPISFDADDVRMKKTEVFKALHPITADDVVRGQYGSGKMGGKKVSAYRSEDDVAKNSPTETYVAMRLMIDNWRWAGVPFYLRTGKCLSQRYTEIAIRFKRAPYSLFRDTSVDALNSDWMILHIQPEEGIRITFNAKKPGPDVVLENVAMDFKYGDWFKQSPQVGYETLLYDCFIGDATLFQRADQIEASWAAVQPVLDTWAKSKPRDFPNYAAGSAGPKTADDLLARDGRAWRPL